MLRRVFKAFQYRDFRLMWIGACASTIGTFIQIFAQGWLIYKISGSARLLALDPILQAVPIFLFSLVGGVIADRMERRLLLMASQAIQMFCAIVLTFLVGFHVVKVWHMLLSSFICGFGQAFGGPAYSALIPTLVKKEDMPNAIALNSMQFNAAVAVGPALGGLAMAKLGATWCFALNAVSFIAPVIALSMLTARYVPEKTKETILASMKQGIGFIRKQGAMEALMILGFCMTALFIPMRTFLPVFAKDIFHRDAGTYAMFLSLSGAGSIIGALATAGLGNVRHKGRIALTMLICLGACTTGFGLSHSLVLSCGMLFLTGICMMVGFAMMSSMVQLIVTEEMRGRVMSVYNFAFRGGMPMGNLVTGWLVPIFTAPTVLTCNGLLLIALGSYYLLAQRRVASLW